jgi:predicted MFS family arabinose efflux permease
VQQSYTCDSQAFPVATLVLLAAAIFAAITTEMLPVGLLPAISRGLGTSESRVGLLISAYAAVVALGSIPLTALVARWSRRTVLCTLLGLYACSNALLASTDDYWIALVARLLGGLAHAGFFSIVFGIAVAIVAPAKTGRAVSLLGAGNVLALALGVPLGTAVGNAVGWRWAFAGSGVAMVAIGVLAALLVPGGHSPATEGHAPVLTTIREPAILRVAALVTLVTLGHYTLFAYVTPLLRHAGIGRDSTSLVLLGYGGAGAIGLALTSIVVDRHPRTALRGAVAAVVVVLVCLGLVRSASATVALVIGWGALFGAFPTLLQSRALRAVPRSPDSGSAIVNSTFNVGIAGGALIGGRELLVASPAVLAFTGAAIVACALALLVRSG